MPDSLDTYIYALAFLVPGFILNSAISVFVPERKVEAQVLILRLLTLSAAHYALWFWLVFVLPNDWYKTYTAWAVAGWLAIVIVSPALIGLLFGYFQQRAVLYRLLRALGFTPLMSDASAWNYKLTRVTRPTNVIVTLDDGSEVAGLF